MQDLVTRFSENLVGRVHGPMNFRLIMQPLMAVFFAIRDGRKDAHDGRVPYFWALFTEPGHRRELLRNGWKSVAKIFIIAIVLDVIYQFIVVRWFYPGEALVVAFFLAIIPYVLLRVPRIALCPRRDGMEQGPKRLNAIPPFEARWMAAEAVVSLTYSDNGLKSGQSYLPGFSHRSAVGGGREESRSTGTPLGLASARRRMGSEHLGGLPR